MRYRWNEYHWPEYTVPTTARWIDEARCFSWRGPEGQGMRLTEEQIRSEWRDLEGEPQRRHPPYVKMTIRNKIDKSSDDIMREWDDLSEGLFYGRDWSNDGSMFVGDGEVYTSGFWFQKTSDAERFVARYGGVRE